MAPFSHDPRATDVRGRNRLLALQADLAKRQQRWLLLGEHAHLGTVLTDKGLRLSFQTTRDPA